MMKFASKLIVIVLLISVCAGMLIPSASASGTIAWGAANASGDGVRIRSGPGLDQSVVTHANCGDPIVIIERTNSDWYLVNYGGTIGYVSAPLLERPRTVADFNANGRIDSASVNMRQRPGTSSDAIGGYSQGTIMNIIGLNEGWYKVRHDNKTGYIRSDLMSVISLDETSSSSNSNVITGKVTGSRVNIRRAPDTNSPALGACTLGTVVEVHGIVNNEWFSVSYNGQSGYMYGRYLQVSSPPPVLENPSASSQSKPASTYVSPSGPAPAYNSSLGQQIVNHALSFTGSRYVYGGSSPSGFDCSGFTYYIYRQFGVNLTRNSAGQYRDNGTHIYKSDLMPGDLVFTSHNGYSVTHVGIYIGDNKMVHASSASTGVIISSLSSGNYSRTFFGAKRVI